MAQEKKKYIYKYITVHVYHSEIRTYLEQCLYVRQRRLSNNGENQILQRDNRIFLSDNLQYQKIWFEWGHGE